MMQHYDGNPSFSDFSPFGGWSTPAIKQVRVPRVCRRGMQMLLPLLL